MWFWMFMFFFNLMIPLLMMIFGRMMYKHAPKTINRVYGYRTKMSMKNAETWKFAHDYCGRLWLKTGCMILILSIIAQLPFLHSDQDTIGTVGCILCIIQTIALICSIIPVERALKANFDKEGRRR